MSFIPVQFLRCPITPSDSTSHFQTALLASKSTHAGTPHATRTGSATLPCAYLSPMHVKRPHQPPLVLRIGQQAAAQPLLQGCRKRWGQHGHA